MKKILIYILLMGIAMLSSCIDDDTFSASPMNRLTFDTDTVRMDTIFSNVPTCTKTFWIHNYSGDGIRCTSIKLEHGNQTGYRVNVNGIYLSESRGYQIFNEEIRKGDSIRVFVELTSPMNMQKTPQQVSDNLVFTLESGVQQRVNLDAWSWDAEMIRDLVVESDYTFSDKDTPTVIYGGITVKEGATLTIPAGKTLYLHDGVDIHVHGTLKCKGTAMEQITLRGDRLDNMFDYLPYNLVPGQWGSIVLEDGSYENEIEYTDIHSATDGIGCITTSDTYAKDGLERRKLALSHSTIHNCSGNALYSILSDISISNSQLTNTYDDVLAIVGGRATVNNCTLAQFCPFVSFPGTTLTLMNYAKNDGEEPIGITEFIMTNSIVTGMLDNVVSGMELMTKDKEGKFSISNCLLRTNEVKDDERFKDNIWEDTADQLTYGAANFVLINHDKQRYDFHLKETSHAIDAADPETSLKDDRDGTLRFDTPDIGCYEFQK